MNHFRGQPYVIEDERPIFQCHVIAFTPKAVYTVPPKSGRSTPMYCELTLTLSYYGLPPPVPHLPSEIPLPSPPPFPPFHSISLPSRYCLTSLKLICPSLSSSTVFIISFKARCVCGSPSFSIIRFSSIKSMKLL